MTDEPFIRLPIPNGRVDDDHLSTVERAFVDALAEQPRDRLRAIVTELLSVEKFRIELDTLMLDLEEGL
jgi:hypothetical protein